MNGRRAYSKTFGLIGVNRETRECHPKGSLKVLGGLFDEMR